MEKQCRICGEIKPLTEFHKSKACKYGYKHECKSCRSKSAKQARVANGGTNRIDRSLEPPGFKLCSNCKGLKEEKEFKNSTWCIECRRDYHRKQYGYKPKFIPLITSTQKQCGICKELKDFSNFSPSKKSSLGLSAWCKPCASSYVVKSLSKEERRIKTQRYRDKNREWWRSLHRINQYNRRAIIKIKSDGTVTPDFVKSVYNESICYYCKEDTPVKFRTLEHKLPLKRGGLHSKDNIAMACLSCNTSKGKMTEQEFITYKNKTNELN